jgi:hypothetical protein
MRRLLSVAALAMVLAVPATAGAAGRGYFHTSGSRILDADNQPVRIAGVNWAAIGCVAITRTVVPVSPARAGADTYLEAGFTSGTLAPAPRRATSSCASQSRTGRH